MSKKSKFIVYTIFALSLVAISALAYMFITDAKLNIRNETQQYLSEVSLLSAQLVEKQIKSDINTLTLNAALIQIRDSNPETVFTMLKETEQRYAFKRMGIILPSGIAYTSDRHTVDLSHRDFFKRAMRGESHISDVLVDLIDSSMITVYATPIYQKGAITAVFFGTQNIDVYSEIVNVETFNGAGYCYIVKTNGDFIAIPSMATLKNRIKQLSDNIFTEILKTDLSTTDFLRFKADIINGKNGLISYTIDDIKKQMAYTKIPSKDWVLLSVVQSDIVSKNTNDLVTKCIMVAALIICFIMLFLCIMIARERIGQQELENIAFVDKITRFSTWEKFKRDAVCILKNNKGKHAIISFDMQNFKMYNDVYGHDKANDLLLKIATHVSELCKENETFCRISADNFVILVSYATTTEIDLRITEFLKRLYTIDEANTFSCKFGVYAINDTLLTINAYCDKAYIAKAISKKNTYTIISYYDETMHQRMIAEKELEDTMEKSLQEGEFIMYLQPKVAIETGKTIGAEALVRWLHPQQGLIPPIHFLPLFEQNGFITEIDTVICRQACQLIRKWIDQGQTPIPISINFSRLHLHKKNFIETVNKIVESYKVPHKYIEIEITETTIIDFENENYLKRVIKEFQTQGYKVSMDDFGSGYSSLNMLSELPVDVLKIDKRFFDDVHFNSNSKSIIAGVINIAKELNMEIVAEGIERESHVAMLKEMKCDMIQGYYFARPMPVDEFELFLSKSQVFFIQDSGKTTQKTV